MRQFTFAFIFVLFAIVNANAAASAYTSNGQLSTDLRYNNAYRCYHEIVFKTHGAATGAKSVRYTENRLYEACKQANMPLSASTYVTVTTNNVTHSVFLIDLAYAHWGIVRSNLVWLQKRDPVFLSLSQNEQKAMIAFIHEQHDKLEDLIRQLGSVDFLV